MRLKFSPASCQRGKNPPASINQNLRCDMPRDKDETRQPRVARCSFCDKTQDQVRRIIAGNGVYICDECVALCQEIISDDLGTAPSQEPQNLPKPA